MPITFPPMQCGTQPIQTEAEKWQMWGWSMRRAPRWGTLSLDSRAQGSLAWAFSVHPQPPAWWRSGSSSALTRSRVQPGCIPRIRDNFPNASLPPLGCQILTKGRNLDLEGECQATAACPNGSTEWAGRGLEERYWVGGWGERKAKASTRAAQLAKRRVVGTRGMKQHVGEWLECLPWV